MTPINVTKSFLPPCEEYEAYIREIFDRVWLTNAGPLVLRLEDELKEFLGVKHLFFCSNGTVALQIAMKALDIRRTVITTPFSYCATSHSVLWEGCPLQFADVLPQTLCLDPARIEELITPDTEAIMGTHVYGLPCDVHAIQALADKHNLKVIYDGAHAFGVNYDGKSLLAYGDIATCSFHATKLFHTVEGGAIITNDEELARKINLYRSFGHQGQEFDDYHSIGINGKNSEFHAAMGLCVLPHVPELIARRKSISERYDALLLSTGQVKRPLIPKGVEYNYPYYPIFFENEDQMHQVRRALADEQVFTRRYFFPSLNTLGFMPVRQDCPVSEAAAARVLCLPLYPDLAAEDVERIGGIVAETLGQSVILS
ncbi:MAG: DegT/DnrJ/EryC1/StrS family aminotransferase [Sphingobacteriaceae bacterium]|nr:DegT/DnrJ/EryC1/StrS family aminotransferase [Cytophagaceae bacterium]